MQDNQNNDQDRLITPWGYIGYAFLFSVPLIGLICILVFAFSSGYPCRRNYARSFLIMIIIAVVIVAIGMALGVNYISILRDEGYRRFY